MLVLHHHLPYVRHPEYDDFMEERWLFEAISETYIPLIKMFERLDEDKVYFRMAMSFTPPLMSMLDDELLQNRYIRYLKNTIELCSKEIEKTKQNPRLNKLAQYYYDRYSDDLYIFQEKYNKNIINAYKKYQELGYIEIMTCCATHGFLPHMTIHPEAIRAQLEVACNSYNKFFNKRPKGIWLAECAYVKEVEPFLNEQGLKYFIIETHGVELADPTPIYGHYAPIVSPKGIIAFPRDTESSQQVWSAEVGYPGNEHYREFYRDLGFDSDFEYIKPYINPDGARVMTGIKYYRITDKTNEKDIYDINKAKETAKVDAKDFVNKRVQQISRIEQCFDEYTYPLVVSPYDAELYGHWWYEGPLFLENVFREAAKQDTFEFITPSGYLEKSKYIQVSQMADSTWGHKGYNEFWLNPSNDWVYRHFHEIEERMIELANRYNESYGIIKRALNQCAREVLLAQSSDWAFIMSTNTTVGYASKRVVTHIGRFNELYNQITENMVKEDYLAVLEFKDNIFPEIDYKVYRTIKNL